MANNSNKVVAGIENINLYASTQSVDLAMLAAARSAITEAHLANVGFRSRSVLPVYEDAVTLAVNAARPIVDACGAEHFELLVVATESAIDFGKPISTYVHKLLGLPARCRNFEVKHACYSGTSALNIASQWVRSGDAKGKKALVIMTDVARRHFNEPAELNGGCGAVALCVSDDPRVALLETGAGIAADEIYDVARPTAAIEWNDPLLSLYAYLDLFGMAWEDYAETVGDASPDRFARVMYHTPLVSLARQAHGSWLEMVGTASRRPAGQLAFESMVLPSLTYNQQTANLYSASLYVSLAGLLDGDATLAPGDRIGMFSYGSGSCAEYFAVQVGPDAARLLREKGLQAHLDARRPLDLAGYEEAILSSEALQARQDAVTPRDGEPHYEQCYRGRSRLVLQEIRNFHRLYGWS
jgi:3-hydroxy-3-methylglutaryl CoA synthase